MAQLAFKGIQLVKASVFEAQGFSADKSILYFVRTNDTKEGNPKTDGYIYLNGKKYGTGADVIAKYGELDGKTIAAYVAEQIKTVNTAATELEKKVTANTTAIGVINGEGVGSIKKALADAKSYTDGVKTDLIGAEATEGTIKHAEKLAKDAATAVTAEKERAEGIETQLRSDVDAKVKSVEGTDTVVATTTEHAVSVSLKTSDKGNVKFTQDTDGLSANVTIPAATVTGIKADDKFLTLTDKLVGADVSIAYDAADKKIYLYGKDKIKANAVSSIDCKDFIKDGMLSNAELVTNPEGQKAGTYIKLTWNTDAGDKEMYLDVTSLIDVYTAKADGGLNLEDHAFSVDTTKIATVESVNGVAGKVATLEGKVGSAAAGETAATGLFKGVADNKATIDEEVARAKGAEQANATAIKDLKAQVAKDVVTVENAADDKYVTVTKAKDNNAYTVASKGIDTAIKTAADAVKVSVTNGTYINGSVDAAGRAITLSETVQEVATSGEAAKGLAEASDVKAYVDGKVSGKNVSATGDTLVSASAADNKVTVAATKALTDAVAHANSAVQSVNGKEGTAVVLNATEIEVGAEVGEQAATAKVNAVLADIYTKLGVVVKADGKTIKEAADHTLSVNLEAKETAQANGHVALEHGTDGALYGVMYYSGDDAE